MNAKFVQRMPEELHERVKAEAARRGMSVNDFINSAACIEVDSVEVVELREELEQYRKEKRDS